MPEILLPHGHYQELETYRNSAVIFDATADFCARFLSPGDRTCDQMTQAARSGKQNIVEGCMASATRSDGRGVQRERALSLLREVYRELAALDRRELMDKVTTVAKIVKENL